MDLKKSFVYRYLEHVPKFLTKHYRPQRTMGDFFLYYRICDQGYPKIKPDYITKENCLKNAVREFPLEKVKWTVVADNVCDETYKMICRYIPENQVRRVSVGHGAGTFRLVYGEAIKNKPDDFIYFLEDDYLHLPGSYDVLIEAAKCNYADYYTLYDHPDKYGRNSPNPFVTTEGEKSVVYWCRNHHWKVTNSTTMTFAAFVDVLRDDQKTFWRWTETKHPYDFHIFTEMRLFNHKYLLSPIPSLSTHGETEFLSLGIEWDKVV